MTPEEIIYNGYIAEYDDIDTEETREATDSFQLMIECLLPDNQKLQDVLFTEGLHLAEMSQKQGFMAGFTFALEMLGAGRMNINGKGVQKNA